MRYFLLAALIIVFQPLGAQAGEVVGCGVPNSVVMSTETADYCDFHQRRFAYHEEALKHKALLQERRENFIAPQIEARKRYEADLEAFNAGRSSNAP